MAVFFVSGACGLMHEVIWTRLFRHVMGNTTYAVSMVLTVFMGGLALGGYLGGLFMDRRKPAPLKVLTILEGGIALSAVLMPLFIQLAQPLYKAAYSLTGDSFALVTLLRFLFSALLLIVPTTLMGATLPVITHFFAETFHDTGRAAGKLYAVNTFGAVLGTAAAGFFLIPGIGVSRTIYLAAGLNLLLSLSMYFLSRMAIRAEEEPRDARPAARARKVRAQIEPVSYGNSSILVLLIGYGLSGFAALAYEVAWTRTLAMMIGSSVYAFTLILTAFVAGLALGSMFCSWVVNRFRDPLQTLGILQILIGASALAAVPLLGALPLRITGYIARFSESFFIQQTAEFLLVFAIMFIPTLLMGAAFPLATRIFSLKSRSVSRSVGVVYGSNTLGTIFGSFAAGFILIPTIGVQNTILLCVFLNIAVAAGFFLASPSMRLSLKAPAMAGAFLVFLAITLFMPAWDIANMTFGPFYEAVRLSESIATSTEKLQEISDQRKVLFHKDGADASVTVKEFPNGYRALYINGKPDASSHGDLPSQILVAHLPLMLHPNPRQTMVLGLASGVTLGSASLQPTEHIDCLEISPLMVDASHYFDEYNNRPLDNPKVSLILGDGRNHLALSDKKYDVIISEPSNPYFAGLADLFTQDYFRLMRARLNPGGLACAWVQAYLISLDSFKSIVASFQSVFPNMTMWKTLKGDCMMVGAAEDLKVDWGALAERIEDPAIKKDLERISIHSLSDFLGHLIMGPAEAAAFASDGEIHTDDNVKIEFAAPKALVGRQVLIWDLIQAMEDHRAADFSFITGEEHYAGSAAVLQEATDKVAAHGLIYRYNLANQGGSLMNSIELLQEAGRLDPNNPLLSDALEAFRSRAYSLAQSGNPKESIEVFKTILSVAPEDPKANYNLATIYRQQSDYEDALKHYDIAAKADPTYFQAHYNLATLHKYNKDFDLARQHYEMAMKAKEDFYPAYSEYAAMLLEDLPEATADDLLQAVDLAEKGVKITEEKDLQTLVILGEAYSRSDRREDALRIDRKALSLAERMGNPQIMMQVRGQLARHENDG